MRRRDFIDMNGDGLADLVEGGDCIDPLKDGEPSPCAVKVWLNLGYGFSNPVDWLGARGVLGERSNSTGFGISAGYSNSENDGGYQGGISANLNTSRQDRVLLDVNGDGLPDLVYLAGDKIKALLNTGTGFTANPVEIGTIPSGLKPGGWDEPKLTRRQLAAPSPILFPFGGCRRSILPSTRTSRSRIR